MDRSSIEKLLVTVAIHYPSFRKHIETQDGKLSNAVVNEWHRCIGFLDYNDALKKLDAYLSTESRYAPTVNWFMSYKAPSAPRVQMSTERHQYHVIRGRLFDEEMREYGLPECDKPFYYDENGHICQDGKVVFR